MLLDAEDALVRWSRSADAPRLANPGALATAGKRAPSEDQLAAIEAVATSGRRLDLMVGPAGAGKTTALSALVEAWQAEHGAGSVTALAPSSAAAEVLGQSLGAPADNTAMWLTLRRAAAGTAWRTSSASSCVLLTGSPSCRRFTTAAAIREANRSSP